MPQTSHQKQAAQAVGAYLAANELNPTWLVEKTGADPGTIGDFLNLKRWPKLATQGKIEAALGWPAGSIRQLGNGEDAEQLGLTTSPGQPADGSPGLSTAELTASLLRARGETDDLKADVRALEQRIAVLEQRAESFWSSVPDIGVAARSIGKKSAGQAHRAHLDQVGEDSQDHGDTDPA